MSADPDCCICLGVLTRPATLPCGHAFCLACIGEYWRLSTSQCPLCKAHFPTRPDLQPPALPEDNRAPPAPLAAGEVPCDTCSAGGRRAVAVTSCLACLASYCPLHLEPHYRHAELWHHRLVSTVKNVEGGGAACRHHGRTVDRFCRSDRTCICALCANADHRGHRIVPISKEVARAKAKLNQRLLKLTQTIQERTVQVELRGDRSGGVLGGAEGRPKDLEREILDLQQRKTDLEELSQLADPLSFLVTFLHLRRSYEETMKKMTQEEGAHLFS